MRFGTFSAAPTASCATRSSELDSRGAEGLILDLRGNGGGLLDEAVLSASIFLEEGSIVSTAQPHQGEHDYDAIGDAIDRKPIVVLVNRDTASAAEILTAALKENDLATVVGTRSYGKGVFQEVMTARAGGALDLTVGQYFTADGDLDPRHRGQARRARQGRPEHQQDEALDRAPRRSPDSSSSEPAQASGVRRPSPRGGSSVVEPLFERGPR